MTKPLTPQTEEITKDVPKSGEIPQLSADQYRCPACKFTTGRVVFLAEGECPACGKRYCGETVDELVIERARADERKKVIEVIEEQLRQFQLIYGQFDSYTGDMIGYRIAGGKESAEVLITYLFAKLIQLKGEGK